MTHLVRRLIFLFCAAFTLCASGCTGFSSNPSYFPYYLWSGDVVRTHAKPIGPGYYADFDPHAIDLALEPQVMTSQVGSQVVVLATVRDEKGNPRRNRRLDWMVTGGNLVEVDESGCANGRGGKEGNTGWSYTNWGEHRLSRGNNNKADDIMLRPGQSWAVVSSPVEGDTHISAVVPGIHNWDKRMKTTVVRWVDAVWEFPPRASARFGQEHEFITKLARFTDRAPLAKYRVRYKILDGPPAMLLPSRAQEDFAVSDLNGHAKMRIVQAPPGPGVNPSGVNRVLVEIIRPPDPTSPSGAGVPIITGETSIEWLAPNVQLNHSGPASGALGQNLVFFTTAKNDGRIDSQFVEFTLPIPDGCDFVGSNPPAEPRGGQLVFPFGALGVGQVHTVQTTFKSKKPGTIKSVALMRTGEGIADQKEVNTLVTEPQVKLDILAPATGFVDAPITYVLRIQNPGTGDLEEAQLAVEYDVGLEHDLVKNPGNDPKLNVVRTTVQTIKAGGVKDESIVLTPKRAGPLAIRVRVVAGGLEAQAQHVVNVQRPNVSLRVDGPVKSFVGRPAEWKITVKNEGGADQTGIVVRDRLPAELGFIGAGQGGQSTGGEIVWNIGALKAGQEAVLTLTTESKRATPAAEKTTLLTADGGVSVQVAKRIQIDGIAALRLELTDLEDPVEVGKNAQYRMTITNTGSAPASKINVKATAPELLKPLRAVGPTQESIVGQIVTFGQVDNLQPGAKVTFTFECQALKVGKTLFRVEYSSELNERPIIEEEPTTIVAPLGSPIPAPPAPPGGGVPMPLPNKN